MFNLSIGQVADLSIEQLTPSENIIQNFLEIFSDLGLFINGVTIDLTFSDTAPPPWLHIVTTREKKIWSDQI